MKKSYINPEFEFVSFNFEPVASTETSPAPLINPDPAAILTLSSTAFAIPSESAIPQKYDGVKYYGVNFTTE